MTVFARESDKYNCLPITPFCGTSPIGPGPAINNAASAKESMEEIPLSDPTLRDPHAALDKYDHRMAPAMIIGGVFVALLVVFGIGLVIALDKNFRIKLCRWMSCGRRKEAEATKPPGNRSDIMRVNTLVDDAERGTMRMSFNAPFVRGMPSPLRQESTEGKRSKEDVSQSVQPYDLPVLPARS